MMPSVITQFFMGGNNIKKLESKISKHRSYIEGTCDEIVSSVLIVQQLLHNTLLFNTGNHHFMLIHLQPTSTSIRPHHAFPTGDVLLAPAHAIVGG